MKGENMRGGAIRFGILLAVGLHLGSGPARADLIAHWRLDEPPEAVEPGSVLDSGPSEIHHGTPDFQIDPAVTFGLPGATDDSGTAAGFQMGSIDVPYDEALNPESFTFCVWAKADSVAGYQSVVTSRHDAFPALAGYILYNDIDGNWNFWTGRSGGWDGLVAGPVAVDVWTHIAISFDAVTGTKTIYVDGFPTTTNAQAYVRNFVRDLHLGAGADLGTDYYFDGSLDDAALWETALLEDDILSIIEGGPEAVPDGLVASWKLDEPEGTGGEGSVIDSSGGDHHGSVPGAPYAPGEPGASPNTGTSVAFSNASVDVPYDPALNPESFTVTAWVRPTRSPGFGSVITSRNDVGPGAETQGYILYLDNAGNWAFWTGHGAPGWPAVVGPAAEVGEWQHLAISFDAASGTKALYLNGFLAASAVDQGYVPNVLRDLHIGGGGDLGDQYRFVGSIDDVGLWDEALAETEIQDVIANGIAVEEGPIRFSRGDADAAGDVNITDGIYLLNFLFLGGPEPPCEDAADPDDSGTLNITDGIYVLNFLFTGGPPPAAPYESCGADPTEDPLGCTSFPPCEGAG